MGEKNSKEICKKCNDGEKMKANSKKKQQRKKERQKKNT